MFGREPETRCLEIRDEHGALGDVEDGGARNRLRADHNFGLPKFIGAAQGFFFFVVGQVASLGSVLFVGSAAANVP